MQNSYLRRLIKGNMSHLSYSEKQLANYFLELDKEIINKTIAQLSDETDISQTTIFNFVKKLGFKGFQDFKITIASNISKKNNSTELTAYSDITNEDNSQDISEKIINFNIQSLLSLHQSIDRESLDHILEMLLDSKTLHFFGLGGSTIVAYDSYHKFIRTNFLCNYIGDYHMQLSYSTKLDKDDCVFLFSHSGQTVETINLARVISETDAKVIVLTGNSGSELVKYADESLIIYSEESQFRTETLTSRIMYLTVMDILYTNIMYYDENLSQHSMDKIRSVIGTTKTTNDFIA